MQHDIRSDTEMNIESKHSLKQRMERLDKLQKTPWIYVLIIAIVIAIDIFALYIEYISYNESIPTSTYFIVIGLSIAGLAFFIAYWNLSIQAFKTKYQRELVDEEISTIPKELDLDIDKNLIRLSYKYLDQYYLQTREHAQKGFIVTITVSIFGAIIIAVGLITMFLGHTDPSYITTASGVIIEFISAIYFHLYNKTVRGMNSYHKKLVISQNIALSLKIANSLETNKDIAKISIINELIKDVNLHIEE